MVRRVACGGRELTATRQWFTFCFIVRTDIGDGAIALTVVAHHTVFHQAVARKCPRTARHGMELTWVQEVGCHICNHFQDLKCVVWSMNDRELTLSRYRPDITGGGAPNYPMQPGPPGGPAYK